MKIGFACKVIQSLEFQNPDTFHTKTTTVTALSKLSTEDQAYKLDMLISHNLQAIENLVTTVSSLTPTLRMVRLPGDILPLYTHPITTDYYKDSVTMRFVELWLYKIGQIARSAGTRLSFHPAQMILLSSVNDDVTTRSIAELEYHVKLAQMMGFCKTFQDIKCNIHVNGGGVDAFRSNWSKISPELKQIITVENDEYTSPVQSCIKLKDLCPIVFDLHHQWIYSGEYMTHTDDNIKHVVESWRGVTPTMHASVSQARLLKHNPPSSYNKPELRRHSSMLWDNGVNDILHGYHTEAKFDIMVEAKMKNLASVALHDYFIGRS